MPNGDSHPYVASASINGDQITFSVEVTEFGPAKGSVEISGQATQDSGAFASIYKVVPIPKSPNGKGDDAGRYFVKVTADTVPPNPFNISEPVIVYVTVSRPWITVLDSNVTSATTWGPAKVETHIDGSRWVRKGSPSKLFPL